MHLFLSIFALIMLVKFARAMHWRRYHGCGGGFADPWRARRRMYRRWQRHVRHAMWPHYGAYDDDAFDLGAPMPDEFDEQFYGRNRPTGAREDVVQRVDEIMRALELNARQTAEAGDALASVRAAVGPERYPRASEVLLALRAAGKTPFDSDLAEAALGPRLVGEAGREAREALEHLHHILTEEQRATLIKTLDARRGQ